MAYPDVELTAQDVHNAFCAADRENACKWDDLPEIIKLKYDEMAYQLSREINARLAWFECEKGGTH